MIYWATVYGVCKQDAPFFKEGLSKIKLVVVTCLNLKLLKENCYDLCLQLLAKGNQKNPLRRRLKYLFGPYVTINITEDRSTYQEIKHRLQL